MWIYKEYHTTKVHSRMLHCDLKERHRWLCIMQDTIEQNKHHCMQPLQSSHICNISPLALAHRCLVAGCLKFMNTMKGHDVRKASNKHQCTGATKLGVGI